MNYYVVTYTGPFGFIKPWTAVRDSVTFSQQFLTPSIIEGIRQKLEASSILRHRLRYEGITPQQERTQSRDWEIRKTQKIMTRPQSILTRGLLLNPVLLLAFENETDAQKAAKQHICLCRNEDLLMPAEKIEIMSEESLNQQPGFELRFNNEKNGFLVGFDRFNNNQPMYGNLEIYGTAGHYGTV